MDTQEAAQRLEELAKKIAYHDHLYYNLAQPEISDHEYDLLRQENARLEALFPHLVRLDSPLHRVGSTPMQDFQKVVHQIPMISLEDVFSEEDLKGFFEKMYRFLNMPMNSFVEIWGEPKIDGLSASLIYEYGILKQAATRGDGLVGEDVTQNIKTIQDIPLVLKNEKAASLKRLEIRGEVYMTKQIFERINADRLQKRETLFSNPRNAAAGSLRQLDSNITKERHLHFFAYEIIVSDFLFSTQNLLMSSLKEWGFSTTSYVKLCQSLQDILDYYQNIGKNRKNLPYEIDGVVYKVNDRALQARLGTIGRVPRHSVAHKFPAEQVKTYLKDIILQVGRMGTITPVAILEPVVIGGVRVNRATLHNVDEIARLDIHIGDTIILQRAGDVIPQIVRVIKEKRPPNSQSFILPSSCPSCQRLLVRDEDKVAVRCSGGFECPTQAQERLSHFVSRDAFDIEGLGGRNIEFLYKTKRIRNFADIFTLKERNESYKKIYESEGLQDFGGSDKYLPLEKEKGWGPLSVKKLFQSIENRRSIPLDRFIYAIGISQIGKQTAILLAQHYKTLSNFLECTLSQLTHIEGIGRKTAEEILQFLKNDEQCQLIKDLKNRVSILPYDNFSQKNLPLSDKIIVFTGKLENLSRNEAKVQAIRLGAKIGSSVTSQTNFVIVGVDAGQKKAAAERLGIQVLNEKEWLNMIKPYTSYGS